jgi:hypothetical protein
MWALSIKALGRGKGSIFIVKALYLGEFGKEIKRLKANLFFSTGIFSRANLKTIQGIMECIGTKMATHMRGHGKMMSKKDLASLSYQMASIMKGSLPRAISMGKESTNGQMVICTMAIFSWISGKAWESTSGRIKEFIEENGDLTV